MERSKDVTDTAQLAIFVSVVVKNFKIMEELAALVPLTTVVGMTCPQITRYF
jgi:hypothetical protein